jgi:hypothetical protein
VRSVDERQSLAQLRETSTMTTLALKLQRQYKGAFIHLEYQQIIKQEATTDASRFNSAAQSSGEFVVSFNKDVKDMRGNLAGK